MQEYQLRLGEGVLQVPSWLFDALLIWLAAMGVVIFLFGRRLVRPALAAVGLLGGAAGVITLLHPVIQKQWPEASPLPFVFMGGLIGSLAAFLLWRLGVGAIMAVTVGLVAPTAFIILFGLQGPDIGPPISQAGGQLKSVLAESSSKTNPRELPQVLEPLSAGRDGVVKACQTWWQNQTVSTRWMLGTLMGGGAMIALFIGFALPRFSSTVVTAFFGTLFMIGLLYRLAQLMGDRMPTHLPDNPRSILYLIGGTTLAGILLQCVFFREPKAEKA